MTKKNTSPTIVEDSDEQGEDDSSSSSSSDASCSSDEECIAVGDSLSHTKEEHLRYYVVPLSLTHLYK